MKNGYKKKNGNKSMATKEKCIWGKKKVYKTP